MRILFIEDEVRFAESCAFHLKKQRFLVDIAYDGPTGLAMAESKIFDVIILDRMLPGMDGVRILKELRSKGIKTPIIFLTAKDSVANRVEGLDAGADDYLVKPFAREELMARIRALLRRPEQLSSDMLQVGSLVLDLQRCEVYCEDVTVKLTLKEAQLLELLMKNYNIVLTKERIFEKIWGYASEADLANIETYICYLRRKIGVLKSRVSISTVRGIGYYLGGERCE